MDEFSIINPFRGYQVFTRYRVKSDSILKLRQQWMQLCGEVIKYNLKYCLDSLQIFPLGIFVFS